MSLLSILAMTFGIIMGLANIPQVYKIFKRKSAKDISPITYSLLFIGSIVWFSYGLEIENFPVIIGNGVGIIVIAVLLIGWWRYK